MKANFLCPHCRTFLNVGEKIVIAARNKAGRPGLLLFSIRLGDYEIVKHSSFDLEKNERVKMFCPVCQETLRVSEIHENIYRILMQDEEDYEYEILFSGIYGERCTYLVREKVVESFGEHASRYIEFANSMKIRP